MQYGPASFSEHLPLRQPAGERVELLRDERAHLLPFLYDGELALVESPCARTARAAHRPSTCTRRRDTSPQSSTAGQMPAAMPEARRVRHRADDLVALAHAAEAEAERAALDAAALRHLVELDLPRISPASTKRRLTPAVADAAMEAGGAAISLMSWVAAKPRQRQAPRAAAWRGRRAAWRGERGTRVGRAGCSHAAVRDAIEVEIWPVNVSCEGATPAQPVSRAPRRRLGRAKPPHVGLVAAVTAARRRDGRACAATTLCLCSGCGCCRAAIGDAARRRGRRVPQVACHLAANSQLRPDLVADCGRGRLGPRPPWRGAIVPPPAPLEQALVSTAGCAATPGAQRSSSPSAPTARCCSRAQLAMLVGAETRAMPAACADIARGGRARGVYARAARR